MVWEIVLVVQRAESYHWRQASMRSHYRDVETLGFSICFIYQLYMLVDINRKDINKSLIWCTYWIDQTRPNCTWRQSPKGLVHPHNALTGWLFDFMHCINKKYVTKDNLNFFVMYNLIWFSVCCTLLVLGVKLCLQKYVHF